MSNTYKNESINRICSIVAVVSAFLGIVAYFLPFVSFFVSFNYFELVENIGGYIPVAFSVAAFVMTLFLSKNKGSFAIIYLCGIADLLAFVIVLAEMNQGDLISGADVSAAGYVLFMIAHIITFVACLIYRFFGEHSGEAIISKSKKYPKCGEVVNKEVRHCPNRAYDFEGSTSVKPPKPKENTYPKYEKGRGSGDRACPHCGAAIDSDSVFCCFCGKDTRVAAKPRGEEKPKEIYRSTKTCIHCGSMVETGARFCPNCGKDPNKAPETSQSVSRPKGFSAPTDLD